MYILENAWVSITRNKGRNILIGVVILVIAAATAVTLAINNSAGDLIESYAAKYETEATIGVDRDNMMQDFDPKDAGGSMEDLTEKFSAASAVSVEDIESYADSEYVSSYYYTESLGVDGSDLEAASTDFGGGGDNANGNNENGNDNNAPSMPSGGGEVQQDGDFTLKGYSSLESMTEFVEGTYTITDGAVPEDFESQTALINEELATLNDIAVGDTLTVVDPNNSENTLTLTVAGIFSENSSAESGGGMEMFSDSANTIITNVKVVEDFAATDSEMTVTTSPTFILTSSDVVEAFENELREKGLDDSLSVETNLDEVESATSSISNVKTFATTFLIITLVIGTVVLLVINVINIRERKYEIGVLRTIGMKKSAVSGQFLCELGIVAIVGLIGGAAIGAVAAKPVSNMLLENEISANEEASNEVAGNFGFNGDKPSGEVPSDDASGSGDSANASDDSDNASEDSDNASEDSANASDDTGNANANSGGGGMFDKIQGVATLQAYDSIDAVVDLRVLAELIGIGLIVVLISGAGAMISIQRFSPLVILKERS